jgi:hypothetical protein
MIGAEHGDAVAGLRVETRPYTAGEPPRALQELGKGCIDRVTERERRATSMRHCTALQE